MCIPEPQRINVTVPAGGSPRHHDGEVVSTMVEHGFKFSEPHRHDSDRALVTLTPEVSTALRRHCVEATESL